MNFSTVYVIVVTIKAGFLLEKTSGGENNRSLFSETITYCFYYSCYCIFFNFKGGQGFRRESHLREGGPLPSPPL